LELSRVALLFGWLELGFVLLVGGLMPAGVFVVFSGVPCLLLILGGLGVGWATQRPTTVARKGDSL
jgi:hypothetical protein